MKPRLGFVGLGWIGLDRLKAVMADGVADIVALSDPSEEAIDRARPFAGGARVVGSLEEVLAVGVDGVVIATPSALHAEQSIAALAGGAAVFCQKPLGRDAAEVRAVVEAAREADRRLGVDLSYRHTAALEAIRATAAEGGIGRVYAADVVFHNAYGPDKEWYRDRRRSGGGCVMDLGIHVVDAALWVLGFPKVEAVRGTVWSKGRVLRPDADDNEDHAVAELSLEGGGRVRVTCSWWLPAGRDAEITMDFWGTEGALRFRNLNGSFYDFVAERCRGTSAEPIAQPPDAWGGRAAVAWARALAHRPGFDPEVERQVEVARVLEQIYRG